MLISLNQLKLGLGDIKISDDELVKLIGARLVEVEGVIDHTHEYDGIYVVQVKYAEKIPDTHLTRCLIDDGGKATDVKRDDDGYVQVMCGAPNVHEGMFAVWIAPGAIVPATFNDEEPFKIGMRKMLKQYDSYGMMAGADELDLGDDHSGIVELNPAHVKAGQAFKDLFGGLDDKILDIENKSLTHRPDTFGIMGFRREVAGILGQQYKSEDWYTNPTQSFKNSSDVKLDIEVDEKLCPRYTAIVFESSLGGVERYLDYEAVQLCRAGMRPVSMIVDATNIMMLITGQPLHAFDYDKFVKVGGTDTPKIIVRAAKPGEKLTLLDGKEVEMNSDDIVITSNDVPVALAGAMGGANTAIDENTKRIILESATFSLYNLRKTQMAHGIFSEAITRFTKGQPAGQTLPVALRFAEVTSKYLKPLALFDSQKTAPAAEVVDVELSQINNLLGMKFTIAEAQKILENVEFDVKVSGEKMSVTVPFWRTDIHIPEDIIEEVGRLSGYDNIAPVLPLHATSDKNASFELKSELRDILSAFGANETLTYSFVHGDLIQKVGQDTANSYRIVNSISPDLQYIRQSIVPSLLDKSYANIRAGYDKFALFEMNQIYSRTNGVDEDGVPQNAHHLAFICVDQAGKSGFYTAKKYLLEMLKKMGISADVKPFLVAKDQTNAYYEPKRSANIECDGKLLGHLGEIKSSILRQMKLPLGTAAFEVSLDEILAINRSSTKHFRLSQYPFVSRDVTLSVATDAAYGEFESKIDTIFKEAGLIYRIKPSSIYRAEGSEQKNLSFHLEFAHPDKTLAKNEIQAIMNQIEAIK